MPYSSDFGDSPPQQPNPIAPPPALHPPTPTTRPRLRGLILPVLWFLFVGLTAFGAVSNAVSFARSLAGNDGAYGFSLTGSLAGPFALDLWACLAALFLGLVVVRNPRGWRNGPRFALGGLALAMMAGRLVGGGAFGLAMAYVAVPPWFALLGAPPALLSGGALLAMVISAVFFALFATFVVVPNWVFRQIRAFEKELQIYRVQTEGLSGYVSRFLYWLRNEEPPPALPDESRGARLATLPEISQLHMPTTPDAMTFGHLGQPLALKTDKHVLIMASTRSGKGVTLIIPHLLRYPGSAFVLDPKGENARATGRRRGKLNNSVHYLDPFGISGKPQSRFNPLSRFTPENMEAESKALAAALFVVSDRERDHWMASGQQLLAAIILFVYLSDTIPQNEKDLRTVRQTLLGNLPNALNAMVEIDAADGLLRDLAISFLETPEKERGSIISTAQRQTEILDNPFISACLSAKNIGPEVDFKAWHSGTMTVYLCLSAPKFPVFNRWLRLVLTSALDEMTDRLNPPKMPVCFMLDELATLGHLPAVENAVGLAAGYGIQLVTVFQDIAQMKDLYKSRWASFIGNAGVRALFNLDDFDTAEYWSKFIGGRLVETASRQEDWYGLSSGQNISETMRPLLSPDKIMMDFAAGKMLVLMQGAHPMITDRVPYWNDTALNGLWDDPRVVGGATAGKLPQPTAAFSVKVPTSPSPVPVPVPVPEENFAGKSLEEIAAVVSTWLVDDDKPTTEIKQDYVARAVGAYAFPYDTSRNALCHCGSGLKFKKCHGAVE